MCVCDFSSVKCENLSVFLRDLKTSLLDYKTTWQCPMDCEFERVMATEDGIRQSFVHGQFIPYVVNIYTRRFFSPFGVCYLNLLYKKFSQLYVFQLNYYKCIIDKLLNTTYYDLRYILLLKHIIIKILYFAKVHLLIPAFRSFDLYKIYLHIYLAVLYYDNDCNFTIYKLLYKINYKTQCILLFIMYKIIEILDPVKLLCIIYRKFSLTFIHLFAFEKVTYLSNMLLFVALYFSNGCNFKHWNEICLVLTNYLIISPHTSTYTTTPLFKDKNILPLKWIISPYYEFHLIHYSFFYQND